MSLEMLAGSGGPGGGGNAVTGGTAGPSGTGPLTANTATGAKNINIGGNPNITSGAFTPALIVGGVLLAVYLWRKSK
jgi:hypothetical protein